MKKSSVIVLLIFVVISIYIVKNKEKDNLPIVLKKKLQSDKIKRFGSPWITLKKRDELSRPEIKSRKVKDETSTQKKTIYDDKEMYHLAEKLESGLKDILLLDENKIDDGITIADELISRDPNLYSAYKAKLILLLKRESILGFNKDDFLIEEILGTMASFNTQSDQYLKKEAFLLSRYNTDLIHIFEEIEFYENELEESIGDEKYNEVEEILSLKIEQAEELEDRIENQGLDEDEEVFNEDLIEIPFYRALANKQYDMVIEDASEFIEEFPNSIYGYFFMIRALELSEEQDEYLDFIENLELSSENLRELENRLDETKNENPKDFWMRLRF